MKCKAKYLSFILFSGAIFMASQAIAEDQSQAQYSESFSSYSSFYSEVTGSKPVSKASSFEVKVTSGSADDCGSESGKVESSGKATAKNSSMNSAKTIVRWKGDAKVEIKQNGKSVAIPQGKMQCVALDVPSTGHNSLEITAKDGQGNIVYAMKKIMDSSPLTNKEP